MLIGNQSIYRHGNIDYQRQRTPEGNFVVGNGGVVTVRANNYDGQSSVVLGPGFSAKAGSIFRAYVYGDSYCAPFTYSGDRSANTKAPKQAEKEPRPIISKTTNSVNTKTEKLDAPKPFTLYPNPTTGSLFYTLKENLTFNYSISDITGKEIMSGLINSTNLEIKLHDLEPGIYLITISNDSYKQCDKIILQ